MMSAQQIVQMSREAAAKAAKRNLVPLRVEQEDMDNLRHYLRYMPFLGDYVPEGYELYDEYFVDSSGFGQEGEPALTQEQFFAKVKAGKYYAIVESGEFQVVIGEYRRTE